MEFSVKDWLYGVTQRKPEDDGTHAIIGNTETENLRSMYHLVTWKKSMGGAGITPEAGKWKNVKSVYPLHNKAATRALLVKWSRQLILREEDLDQIRGLFGEKVQAFMISRLITRPLMLTNRSRYTSHSSKHTSSL